MQGGAPVAQGEGALIGNGLQDHAGYQLRQQFQLPSYTPFDGLRERIESAITIYEGARSWRLEQYARLQQQYNEFDDPSAPCVIHDEHGKEILWYRPRVFPPFPTSTTYRLVGVRGISSNWRSTTPTSGGSPTASIKAFSTLTAATT
ncbi:hypothetical protein ACFXG4_46700 [Nocardia sp. NPDC059246]|uniref:hypothetical protein n=1 Tax=unclassified Nocardia TaxID=2637762 RepID=UPI003674EA89